MSDIASEYALELARLGMTQAEIDAMVAEAQRIAAEIAAETEAIFQRLREAGGEVGATPGAQPGLTPDPGVGGGIGGGGAIGGLRPGAGGGVVFDGEVTAATASIDSVALGDFVVNGMSVMVRLPSGRELAGETIDVLVQDAALLDKLGARLNERAARTGQIRRGGP